MKRAMLGLLCLLLPIALSSAVGADKADDKKQEVKVGAKAPDFKLKGSDGKTYKLSDFKGKKGVVIAWYPKAATPG